MGREAEGGICCGLTDRVNRRKLSLTLDADDDGQSMVHRSLPPSVSLLAFAGDAHKDLRCVRVVCVGGESEGKKDGAVFCEAEARAPCSKNKIKIKHLFCVLFVLIKS